MEENIIQLIADYISKVHRADMAMLNVIFNPQSLSEDILKHMRRSPQTISDFLQTEAQIRPLIGQCRTREELEDLAYQHFAPIRGIGPATIEKWVSYMANILDLEQEANCSLLLSKNSRNIIVSSGLNLTQAREKVRTLNAAFEPYDDNQVDAFLSHADRKGLLSELCEELCRRCNSVD